VRVRSEDLRDAVAFLRIRPDDSLSGAVLAVGHLHGHALDVVGLGDHNELVLLGDQILVFDLALGVDDGRAALVVVLLTDLAEFLLDDAQQDLLVCQHLLEPLDGVLDLLVLLLDLGRLHVRQRAQLHADDVGGLALGELELRLQAGPRRVPILAVLNEVDDVVDHLQGLQPALEDVCAVPCLREVVLGAPADDLPAVIDVVFQRLLETQHLWLAVDQRQVDHAEGRLEVAL
jgi:hypothetical protein